MSGNKTMKALVLRKHGGLEELDVVTTIRSPQPSRATW